MYSLNGNTQTKSQGFKKYSYNKMQEEFQSDNRYR